MCTYNRDTYTNTYIATVIQGMVINYTKLLSTIHSEIPLQN